MPPKFDDPYKPIPDDNRKRFVSMVSTEDYLFIKSVRPQTGTIQNTVNYMVKWLVNELKHRNITDHSRYADYEQFVVNTFGLPHLGNVSETDDHNDAGGATIRSATHPDVARQRTEPQSRVVSSVGTKRKGKTIFTTKS